MRSYPSRSEVLDVLGSKIVGVLSEAVRRAEADFEEYRRLHPGWAARHTERTLEGLERVHLCAGYQWDRETRSMGSAVLSLRDGQDNVIWLEELAPPAEGSTARGTTMPPLPTPPLPSIDTGEDAEAPEDGSA